jgi:lysophospholipase L1-like esterase
MRYLRATETSTKGKNMSALRCQFLMLIALTTVRNLAAAEPSTAFPLKEGDVWVMAGDSITAQHLHSNYFEAFCYARYPNLKFAFRNSGVGGHTIPTTLARFDYDIGAWKPTIVSVELGMNDKGSTPTDRFLINMKTMVDRIRSINARPVILAASPVNNGETLAKLAGGNQRLHEYAAALKDFCQKENIPYADQFHALLDVWGQNKPRETLANSVVMLKQLAQDDALAGAEHLRLFLAAQDKNPDEPVSMQGDPVHPGPPGQLMMAAALLKGLGADGFVSSVTIDPAGKLVEAKGCQVDDITSRDGVLAFDRLDQRLPFPIPDEARAVVALFPAILELSQYNLKVTGLKPKQYTLKINGTAAATLTAKQLQTGVNLTALAPDGQASGANPIAAQGRAILGAVTAKESLVSQWRSLSQKAHAAGAAPELKEQLAALTTKVEEADAGIRAAARPQKLHFEIVAVQ